MTIRLTTIPKIKTLSWIKSFLEGAEVFDEDQVCNSKVRNESQNKMKRKCKVEHRQ